MEDAGKRKAGVPCSEVHFCEVNQSVMSRGVALTNASPYHWFCLENKVCGRSSGPELVWNVSLAAIAEIGEYDPRLTLANLRFTAMLMTE